MHGVAWLLNDLFFDNFWAGFFVEAALFLLIAAGAGFFAYRSFQNGVAARRPTWRSRRRRRSRPPSTTRKRREPDGVKHEHARQRLGRHQQRPLGAAPSGHPLGSDEIRRDIVAQRTELSRSVDALRGRWVEVTDIGAQIKKHKTELIVGAAVVGFLVGGVIALRRRR